MPPPYNVCRRTLITPLSSVRTVADVELQNTVISPTTKKDPNVLIRLIRELARAQPAKRVSYALNHAGYLLQHYECAAQKYVIIKIPYDRLSRVRVEQEVIWMAVAIKIGHTGHAPTRRKSRADPAAE